MHKLASTDQMQTSEMKDHNLYHCSTQMAHGLSEMLRVVGEHEKYRITRN